MERLESSTRWGRTFINKDLCDALRSIRSNFSRKELEEMSGGSKTNPRIHHTTYPDGKVKYYKHKQ